MYMWHGANAATFGKYFESLFQALLRDSRDNCPGKYQTIFNLLGKSNAGYIKINSGIRKMLNPVLIFTLFFIFSDYHNTKKKWLGIIRLHVLPGKAIKLHNQESGVKSIKIKVKKKNVNIKQIYWRKEFRKGKNRVKDEARVDWGKINLFAIEIIWWILHDIWIMSMGNAYNVN